MRLSITVALAIVVAAMLAMGCATSAAPDPQPEDPILPDLSGVTAAAGHVAADAVAGTQLAALNVTVTSAGAPAEGVQVYLLPSTLGNNAPSYFPNATTDAEGLVSFDDVPAITGLRLRVEATATTTQPLTSPTPGAVQDIEITA